MSKNFSFSRVIALGPVLMLGNVLLAPLASAIEYDVRATTGDRVKAVSGAARQGSFGSPAINDQGAVAYACVLSGKGIGGPNSYSIVFRDGKKNGAAKLAIQGGVTRRYDRPGNALTLNNNFLNDPRPSNVYPLDGTGYLFRISKSIALNNHKQIGFAGEAVWTQETDSIKDGKVESSSTTDVRTAVYGSVNVGTSYYSNRSLGGGGNEFYSDLPRVKNTVLTKYLTYFPDILSETVSLNNQGSTVYNASFVITPEESFPGFAWVSPTAGLLVATTASNAIGLPYFTTFQSFSNAVVADNNRCFVVADLSDAGDDFDGIWQGSNSNLQPVVVKNRPAPGGGKYDSFDGTVGPGRKGKLLAFVANITNGPVARGIFRTDLLGENGVRIAAVGQKAPGTDTTFLDFGLAGASDRGYVAFTGDISPAPNTSRNRQGLWLSDISGANLTLVAVEGGTLTVGKTQKTITRITFNPISGLNLKGMIAFTASFTDRTSSVFVAK